MNHEYSDFGVLITSFNMLIEKKLAKMPLYFPVVLDNIEVCNIKIDLEYNKKRKAQKDDALEVKLLYKLLMIVLELDNIITLFKEDIELIADIIDRYEKKMYKFTDLMNFLGKFKDVLFTSYGIFFDIKEEEIFELVKSKGSITLRNLFIQHAIYRWLSDKKSAGVKINKLKDSLLEYYLGVSPKDVPFKLGRLPMSILSNLDSKLVINRYHDISALLKIAKNYAKYYKGNIRNLIRHAEKEIMLSKKDDHDWKDKYEQSIKDKNYEFFHLVWSCIEEDSKLKKLFESFLWEPNSLAKKILARLLDASESTLDNYMSQKK